jgi:hypothetical protein
MIRDDGRYVGTQRVPAHTAAHAEEPSGGAVVSGTAGLRSAGVCAVGGAEAVVTLSSSWAPFSSSRWGAPRGTCEFAKDFGGAARI